MKKKKSHLYALIVGISNYPDMEPLRGCQNDVENVKQALRRYAHRNNLLLNQAILLDSSAGRKEFICKFKSLFYGLKDGDSALFYFSGHGSRMTAPPAFEHSTANGMMETLVLYDSRLEDGWDLNDKELAYLIWKVTQRKKVHFTVILDSCYSSSATKGAAKNSEMDISFRKTSSNKKSRPWQAFAGAQEYIATARGVHVPMARHILMAACRKDEEAQEQRIEGKIQGVLTYALTSCLRQYSSRLTYAELIGRICAMAKDLTHDRQHPQLEGMNQADTQKYFLLPDQKNTPYLHMLHFCKERGWVLNSGMQHGLTAAQKDAKIQLLDDDFFAFAEGHIQSIYDHYSSIRFAQTEPDRTQKYRVGLVVPPSITFAFAPEISPEQRSELTSAWQTYLEQKRQGQNSFQAPLFSYTTKLKQADYWLSVNAKGYYIKTPSNKQAVLWWHSLPSKANCYAYFVPFEKMAKWTYFRSIQNHHHAIDAEEYELNCYELVEADKYYLRAKSKIERPDFRQQQLTLSYGVDKRRDPAILLKIKNKGTRKLWFNIFYLGPDFSIHKLLLSSEDLMPGKEAWLEYFDEKLQLVSRVISLNIPDILLNEGIFESTERFKVFISSTELDLHRFEQKGITPNQKPKALGVKHRYGLLPPVNWMCIDFSVRLVYPTNTEMET